MAIACPPAPPAPRISSRGRANSNRQLTWAVSGPTSKSREQNVRLDRLPRSRIWVQHSSMRNSSQMHAPHDDGQQCRSGGHICSETCGGRRRRRSLQLWKLDGPAEMATPAPGPLNDLSQQRSRTYSQHLNFCSQSFTKSQHNAPRSRWTSIVQKNHGSNCSVICGRFLFA